jgi:tetratricopeptide (TPR) repeat protein
MQATIRHSAVGGMEMAEWEQPFKSVLGCLLQAGLLAARNGMAAEAEAILQPVEAARPSHASTLLARGLVFIYQDRYQEAIDYLDKRILQKDPHNDMAKAFTAMALHLLGRLDECRAILKEVLKTGKSAQAKNLASSLAAEVGMAEAGVAA